MTATSSMLRQVSGYSSAVYAPQSVMDHEVNHPVPNLRKWEFTRDCVHSFGIRSVTELYAGFGALSVEYLSWGVELRTCVESDKDRFLALRANVGDAARCRDNRMALPPDWFDCDMLDLDPYADAAEALFANRYNLSAVHRFLIVTTSVKPFRFHYKNKRAMTKIAKRWGQRPSMAVVENIGQGISQHYVAPFVEMISGRRCRVLDSVHVATTLERALLSLA